MSLYEIEIVPTKPQKEDLTRIFGASRFIYNEILARLFDDIDNGILLSRNEFYKIANDIVEEHKFLKEVDETILLRATEECRNDIKLYIEHGHLKPTFRRKKNPVQKFTFFDNKRRIQVVGGKLYAGDIGIFKLRALTPLRLSIINTTAISLSFTKDYDDYTVTIRCED